MSRIVLASASPRRFEILKQVGIKFEVIPSNADERYDLKERPEIIAKKLSVKKAKSVAEKLKDDSLVIGADTIVVSDVVLGKPENRDEAFKMLELLQGKWHEVITGICVIRAYDGKCIDDFEITRVKMRPLDKNSINAYINAGESMDKAGAYGIQGVGALLIEKIEGCYYNVVGLPLVKLSYMLEEFGYNLLV